MWKHYNMVKECEICGREFKASSVRCKYCPQCGKDVRNGTFKSNEAYAQERARKSAVKRANESEKAINDILLKAQEAGMSYGKYVSKYGVK